MEFSLKEKHPTDVNPPADYKNRTTAGIYGVTLGAFGVHRFYLGYKAIGTVQIIVTLLTCGLGALWGIIEGWLLLGGVSFEKDAAGNPLLRYVEALPSETGSGVAGKNIAIAAMYGVFLGAFGIHRFYLGYTAMGIAQIAVTLLTCGIGALWGMLEGFLILSGYINKDAHGKPLITDVEIAPTEVSSPDGYKYRNKTVAGIYGIFLGSLGIHRFYLGYTTIGIIQIIVTIATSGVGGMWGFVEGILILSDSINEDAEGRPLICFNEEQ